LLGKIIACTVSVAIAIAIAIAIANLPLLMVIPAIDELILF
jgi:hypothetical protein